jgi:hypothetical protein
MKRFRCPPVWLWLNLLSLDAPVVAVLWQDFLARCYPSMLRPAGRLMLGLTVWVIYLADRLLDVRLPPSGPETKAHEFCRRHSRLAGTLLAVALFTDLAVAMQLRRAVFDNGLLVSAGVITYFGAFPMQRMAARWKPISAAILFTTGVFLVAWTGTAVPAWTLGGPASAFCLLCLANLVLISDWERGIRSDRAGVVLLLVFAVCAALGGSPWYSAVAFSAVGLGALALLGNRLAQPARRVLADAVLLTPLLFLWTPIA